jgi:hypothetical protein
MLRPAHTEHSTGIGCDECTVRSLLHGTIINDSDVTAVHPLDKAYIQSSLSLNQKVVTVT